MKKVGFWFYQNENGDKVLEKIKSALEKQCIEVITDFDMRNCYVYNGDIYTEDGRCISDLDMLYHMNADEQSNFQEDILKVLSYSKVKVINDYSSFSIAKDKMLTNFLLRNNGLRVPNALFFSSRSDFEKVEPLLKEWSTFLVKPRRNHCGNGIVKFSDTETLNDFIKCTESFFSDYYIEEFIKFEKHDYRIEIFNGEVVGGYSRGHKHSYKTNIGSGGEMMPIPMKEEHKKIALKASKIIGVTTTIVDIVEDSKNQKPYILEVNPIMGIFIENAMKSGSRMPIQSNFPEIFKSDDKKIACIVDYIKKNI
ncbi:RimK family alpha-L-glutamate ligase [Enterococcus sp. UD-01]|jgi:ribosomal protein S6--L-glutamate ligase|uniref:ATP-grasp domain-containing protein n=1 Tax=Enterococcus sp. UD-01 TaxID=3373911 RepID=UPI003838A314